LGDDRLKKNNQIKKIPAIDDYSSTAVICIMPASITSFV